MPLIRVRWLFLATALLSACNAKCVDCTTQDDPEACRNLTEGRGCMSTVQCAVGLNCFPKNSELELGRCRQPCGGGMCAQTGSTVQQVNCIDVGAPFPPSCVPSPRFDSKWKVVAESLTLPSTNQGRPWDNSGLNDSPEPFVCFTFQSEVGQQSLCTDERTGTQQSWPEGFRAFIPWTLLANVSVSVFDGDALGAFQHCEGACLELATWQKELAYGRAWDLRPQFDGQEQTFTLTDEKGLELKLRLRETFQSQ